MSSYLRKTKHPVTGEWHIAEWLDNYFGLHKYGVRFPSGEVLDARDYDWETDSEEPL